MTQVVEADRTQTVFLQQLRELLGNVVGADDVPDLVHTQIAQILPVVAFTAQAAVGFLLTFQHQQAVTDGRHKGQRPQAGLGFCTISLYQNLFAVDGCLRNDVLDLQRVGFKVDGIPSQTQHLAAAQTIERCQQNRDLQLGALCDLRQSVNLIGTVIATFELVLLRTLDLICRIGGDQVDLHRILQRLVDVCMVMDHRICLDPFKLLVVEILQVGGFQVYQFDAALSEIGNDHTLHHSLIAGIGRNLDSAFRDFKPFQHEVRKENVIV